MSIDTPKLDDFKIQKYLRTEDNITTVLGIHGNSTDSIIQKLFTFPNEQMMLYAVSKVSLL
jgi:hypothetical protein